MATENIVLIEAIKKVHAEKTQDFNRFLKMVDFYGYSGTNKSLSDFFTYQVQRCRTCGS